MNNKVSVTWGSGDLKSSFEVYLGTGKSKKAANLFSSKVTGLILYSWMMTIQYLLYIGVLLACIYLFNSKSKIALLCMIYITGYFTFLLFWEASPRYAMGTVSYTHLRAHETDSYLVCRLLLEKKKNNN